MYPFPHGMHQNLQPTKLKFLGVDGGFGTKISIDVSNLNFSRPDPFYIDESGNRVSFDSVGTVRGYRFGDKVVIGSYGSVFFATDQKTGIFLGDMNAGPSIQFTRVKAISETQTAGVSAACWTGSYHLFACSSAEYQSTFRLYRTADFVTWTEINLVSAGLNYVFRQLLSLGGGVVLAVLYVSDGGCDLFRSTDHGATWTRASATPAFTNSGTDRDAMCVGGSAVYALNSGTDAVFKSINNGASWSKVVGSTFPANQNPSSLQYFSGKLLSLGTAGTGSYNLQYSTNEGITWTNCTWAGGGQNFGKDSDCIIGSTLYVVGDGGRVHTSTDGINFTALQDFGVSWSANAIAIGDT